MTDHPTFWHNPRKAAQVRAIAWVPAVWKDFRLTAVQPNPEKAPWLWHVVVPSGQYVVLVSFWPHLGKAQREDGRTAVGEAEVRKLLKEIVDGPND